MVFKVYLFIKQTDRWPSPKISEICKINQIDPYLKAVQKTVNQKKV